MVEKTFIFMDISFFPFKDESGDNTFSTLSKWTQGCQLFNTVCVYMASVFGVAGSAPISRTFPC